MNNKYFIALDYGYESFELLTACTDLKEAIKMAKRCADYEVFHEHIEVLTFGNNHFEDGELEVHFKINAKQ